MKKIVIATDSFKGSLSSKQAGDIIKDAILSIMEADVKVIPIGDGGEGTKDALVSNNGKIEMIACVNSLNEPIKASYAILQDNTAVIEMADTAGLTLIDEKRRNPLYTSTYGFGLMIKDAINKGCREFIICIGGSGTNDCGIGLLTALGFRFLDENNHVVSLNGLGVKDIRSVDFSNVMRELKDCHFEVVCDVTNPLCGINGCSYVYGPQKGANNEEVVMMDEWIFNYSELLKNKYHMGDAYYPGVGAAGGVGYCFKTFLNAELKKGIDLVVEKIKLEQEIKTCDLVITGEGKLDAQTLKGKTPLGVASLAKKHHKKIIAFCGIAGDDCDKVLSVMDAYYPILDHIDNLQEALDPINASRNLTNKVKEVLSNFRF